MAIAQFRDSTDVLQDASLLRERFAQDGYLFFRGLLDRQAVMEVRRDLLTALGELGWTAPGTDPVDGVPGPDIRREGDEQWWPGYAAINSLFSFHALAHDEAIKKPLRALLGEDILVHPRKIGRVTYPNSEFPTPPHQDFPLIQGASDTFTVWVPFGDFPLEFGGLRVLCHSQEAGLQEVIPKAGVGGVGVDVSEDDPRWATTNYLAGDVLMIHAFTVHWAPPNHGDRIRLSADYRYQSSLDPVVNLSLLPHGFGGIPGWDVLTKGWEATWPVDAPEGITVTEMADPFSVQAPNSKLAGNRA